MIRWTDYVFDKVLGPVLDVPEPGVKVCQEELLAHNRITEDANGKTASQKCEAIQETGQEQRPARMVGLSSSDLPSRAGMEASRGTRAKFPWRRGEE